LQVQWALRIRERVPVRIVERINKNHLALFQRHTTRTLFIGKLPVLAILLTGFWGCIFYFNGRFNTLIENELRTIMNYARVDDMHYQVVDFFQKKGLLIVQVAARLRMKPEHKESIFKRYTLGIDKF
jgi:hypothetical protein